MRIDGLQRSAPTNKANNGQLRIHSPCLRSRPAIQRFFWCALSAERRGAGGSVFALGSRCLSNARRQKGSSCVDWSRDFRDARRSIKVVVKVAGGTHDTMGRGQARVADVTGMCSRLAKQHKPSQQRHSACGFIKALVLLFRYYQLALTPGPKVLPNHQPSTSML